MLQMTNSNLKYLIAGTGGVGGSIAAFLALAGKNVTCIARGEHLAAIHEHGLRLHSDLKGEHTLKIPAYTAEEYTALASSSADFKADVIFVCVKGYSVDSITELIKCAAHKDTVVIPILNVYGTGPRIQRLVPGVTVLDGCIYIVGFVSGKGEITQMGKIFRLVYGAHKNTIVPRETLEVVQHDLQESGIKAEISPDINRDTFVKWSFISAMAVTGAYYDVPMGEVQKPGRIRDTFIGLSQESAALGQKLGIEFKEEPDHEAERTHTHLGVYAVRKRLDYVYQNKARMSITSEPGKGTQVILEIPMNGNVGVTYRKCDEPVNENNKKRGDER